MNVFPTFLRLSLASALLATWQVSASAQTATPAANAAPANPPAATAPAPDNAATGSDKTTAQGDAATPTKQSANPDDQSDAKSATKSNGKATPASGKATAGKKTDSNNDDNAPTRVVSNSLHYDDKQKTSVFTGDVVMTHGAMTLWSNVLTVHENAQGQRFGTATPLPGQKVIITEDKPETFEVVKGQGLRAEYDGANSQVTLIGQAIVTRYICGKPFDHVTGDRVQYDQQTGAYTAVSDNSSGRVHSLAVPSNSVDQAIAQCQLQHGVTPTKVVKPAKSTKSKSTKPARPPHKHSEKS